MFERLKEIRSYEGLTQEEVAKILHVTRSTYAGWECGKDIIPFGKLNEFANLFHVTLDFLIGESPDIEYTTSENKELNKNIISKNLKEFRKSQKLTQAKFAETLKTSQANIHKYETGKSLITTTYALEFTKKYNYSLDKLTGRTK